MKHKMHFVATTDTFSKCFLYNVIMIKKEGNIYIIFVILI